MEYKNKTDISPAILRILKKRGITDPADIEEYMSPTPKRTYDPFLMKGMDEASDMIIEYARGGRRICVYGDYDCDGVTSVSLMMTLLGELAADAWYYIPSRFEEGYGLNKKAIDRIAERGTQLIITVDNGCVAFDEVAYIKEKGMAVIVTDHHNVDTQSPDCIMLDPKQTDDDYPFSFLCGCGVAFKLAQAVTRKTGISKKKLNSLLDIVGIATVGDIVYCTGFNSNVEGEGFDRSFRLTGYQEEMIERLSTAGKKMTVVLNAGGGVDMNRWLDKIDALLMAWYPGQEGGTALAEILTGKISPSGKLPISIEKKWEDNPCHDSYYENRPGRECKTVEYREGVFVGYRGYDANGVKPLFPFGFGLSYSSFDYSNLRVVKENDSWLVSFDLKNTGKKDAAEVAQVYVGCVNPTLPRPLKELKGFEKVFLKHGESRRIQVKLDSDSFSYYDMDQHQFVTVPGSYLVQVGGSSVSLPLKEQILIP